MGIERWREEKTHRISQAAMHWRKSFLFAPPHQSLAAYRNDIVVLSDLCPHCRHRVGLCCTVQRHSPSWCFLLNTFCRDCLPGWYHVSGHRNNILLLPKVCQCFKCFASHYETVVQDRHVQAGSLAMEKYPQFVSVIITLIWRFSPIKTPLLPRKQGRWSIKPQSAVTFLWRPRLMDVFKN